MKTALVLHGWPGLSKGDHEIIDHLKNSGYEVIVPELFSDEYFSIPDDIQKQVEKKLKGKSLDLGIGVSLGGLILPYFAERYPGMKMVFIASGPYLNADLKLFNLSLYLARNRYIFALIMMLVYKLPLSLLSFFYSVINPHNGPASLKEEYKKDMLENIEKIRKISKAKQADILHYIAVEDNSNRLGKLKNKSLIISGKNDLLMPKSGAVKLGQLLVNSELLVNDGSHLNVFNKENLDHIDKFIN